LKTAELDCSFEKLYSADSSVVIPGAINALHLNCSFKRESSSPKMLVTKLIPQERTTHEKQFTTLNLFRAIAKIEIEAGLMPLQKLFKKPLKILAAQFYQRLTFVCRCDTIACASSMFRALSLPQGVADAG